MPAGGVSNFPNMNHASEKSSRGDYKFFTLNKLTLFGLHSLDGHRCLINLKIFSTL